MYRIEVATGEETVFRTIEELATGIRNGVITPRSRIYHAASQKWLPIEFHPHYKKALDLVTGGAPMIDTGLSRPKPSPRRTPAPAPEPRPAASSVPIVQPVPRPEPRTPRASYLPEPIAPAPIPPTPAPAPVAMPSVEPPAVEPRVVPPAADYRRTFEPVPEIELPKISYPEVPSSTDPMPVARRRHGGPGRLAMGGIVLAVLVGGYLATTTSASSSDVAEPVEAPAPEPAPAPVPGEAAAAAPDPNPSVQAPPAAPARSAPAGDLSAARPAGPVSQAWSSSAGAIAAPPPPRAAPSPQATTGQTSPAIAPQPAALDLALPQVPLGDSLLSRRPAHQRDSAAIKRILRAVSGAPAEGGPAR